MFTGIVQGVGTIVSIRRREDDYTLEVDTDGHVPDPAVGESVALDGVCLTVVAASGAVLSFDVSAETIGRTAFTSAREGDRLNIERALALGERMGGHLMQGHVDSVGTVAGIERSGEGYVVEIGLAPEGMRYVVEKGSIAISGISLTVASKRERSITIAVIPHTWEVTTLNEKPAGSTVNIEYDIIAKYVENLVKPYSKPGGGIDEEFLTRHGFS